MIIVDINTMWIELNRATVALSEKAQCISSHSSLVTTALNTPLNTTRCTIELNPTDHINWPVQCNLTESYITDSRLFLD